MRLPVEAEFIKYFLYSFMSVRHLCMNVFVDNYVSECWYYISVLVIIFLCYYWVYIFGAYPK